MFPKSAVASITGLSGMAGQAGSVIFQVIVGFVLTSYAGPGNASAGYDVIFIVCGCAYLAAFALFTFIVPRISMIAPNKTSGTPVS